MIAAVGHGLALSNSFAVVGHGLALSNSFGAFRFQLLRFGAAGGDYRGGTATRDQLLRTRTENQMI